MRDAGWLERTRAVRFVFLAVLGVASAVVLVLMGRLRSAGLTLVLGLVPLLVLALMGGRLPSRHPAGPTEDSIRRAASRGKR